LKCSLEDELLGRKLVLVIPVVTRKRLLKLAHDQLGHVGRQKMLWSLAQRVVWPGMDKQVKENVCSASACARTKLGS